MTEKIQKDSRKPYQVPILVEQGHIAKVTKKTGAYSDTSEPFPSKHVKSAEDI